MDINHVVNESVVKLNDSFAGKLYMYEYATKTPLMAR
jgi:hypothetical protein